MNIDLLGCSKLGEKQILNLSSVLKQIIVENEPLLPYSEFSGPPNPEENEMDMLYFEIDQVKIILISVCNMVKLTNELLHHQGLNDDLQREKQRLNEDLLRLADINAELEVHENIKKEQNSQYAKGIEKVIDQVKQILAEKDDLQSKLEEAQSEILENKCTELDLAKISTHNQSLEDQQKRVIEMYQNDNLQLKRQIEHLEREIQQLSDKKQPLAKENSKIKQQMLLFDDISFPIQSSPDHSRVCLYQQLCQLSAYLNESFKNMKKQSETEKEEDEEYFSMEKQEQTGNKISEKSDIMEETVNLQQILKEKQEKVKKESEQNGKKGGFLLGIHNYLRTKIVKNRIKKGTTSSMIYYKNY